MFSKGEKCTKKNCFYYLKNGKSYQKFLFVVLVLIIESIPLNFASFYRLLVNLYLSPVTIATTTSKRDLKGEYMTIEKVDISSHEDTTVAIAILFVSLRLTLHRLATERRIER